jgi:hypothetical protein
MRMVVVAVFEHGMRTGDPGYWVALQVSER